MDLELEYLIHQVVKQYALTEFGVQPMVVFQLVQFGHQVNGNI